MSRLLAGIETENIGVEPEVRCPHNHQRVDVGTAGQVL